MSAPIRTLGLPSRVVKTLTAAGINTVADAFGVDKDYLLGLRGVTADIVKRLEEMANREMMGEPAVDEDVPVTPWYQKPDWWGGFDEATTWAHIATVSEPGDWLVVPSGFLSREFETRNQPGSVVGPDPLVEALARDTYLELVRTKGYSTEHAKHAWAGAVEFVRQGRLAQETLEGERNGSAQEAK